MKEEEEEEEESQQNIKSNTTLKNRLFEQVIKELKVDRELKIDGKETNIITVRKREHPAWKSHQEFIKFYPNLDTEVIKETFVGRHQFFYSGEKGTISLIELNLSLIDSKQTIIWEVAALNGNEYRKKGRYNSIDEAEKRILEMLM
jgi:hypothetical protein